MSVGDLAVAGAAAHARKTSSTAWDATRARELPAGSTTDARHTAGPAGATARATVLSAGAAGAVAAAAAARVLLEDHVRGRGADRACACFGCRHRHHSHR